MRRKIATILAAVLFATVSMSALSACGDNNENSGGGNEPHAHAYGEWHTTKDATCTEDGERQRECTECDDVEKQTIGKLGHNFVAYLSNGDATCTEDGTETAKCTRCTETDTRTETGSKLGHEFKTYTSDGNATCTADGTETAKCTHTGCTETDTRTIKDSKLGHEFGAYTHDGNATCTDNGTETAQCVHEGCTETDTRPASDGKLGHEFLTYTHDGNATCTDNGTETAHCTHEGCTETDTRPASDGKLGHKYDRTVFGADESVHYYVCSRCGDKEEGTETGHTIVNDYECSVCRWHADGTTSLTYSENDDGGYTVTGTTNQTLTKIVIPDTYQGKPVTAVAGHAFRGDQKEVGKVLEEVVFGKNIKSIGYCAFGYTALKRITIPDNVEVINEYAFYGCESAETVTIGSGPIGIFDYAFYGCSSVETVTLEGGSVSIGKYVFKNCAKLKTFTVGEGTVNIGQESFSFSPALTDVTFGGGKVTIAKWAFDECPNLKSVTIGDGIVDIATCAFIQCPALSELTFGDGSVTIGDWAFQDCTELKTLTFGGSDIEIAQGGFFQCASLTGVDFGDGDISIGAYTFQGCAKLETITIGDGDVVLGTDFVWNCQALTDIVIGDGNVVIGEYAFRNCSLAHFTAGNGNMDFGYCAFYLCGQLADITVGNGDVVFETYSVCFCDHLTDVTIGDGFSVIGDDAFYNCKNLKNVTVGVNIAEIGWDAFDECPAIAYTVKDGVKYLGNKAHPYTVLMGAENKNIKSVVMSADTKLIVNRAFYECKELEHVTFGEHLKKISRWAFMDCVLLQDAIFHDDLQEIEHSAFDGCKALKTVSFGSGIQKIGEYAFDGCDALQTVSIPSLEGWFAIEFAANQFVASANPISMKNATLVAGGQSVTGNVVVPDGVKKIYSLAFAGYEKITSLEIGKDVTEIGAGALMGCKNVTELTVAAGNKTFTAQSNCVYDKTKMSVALGCSTSQISDGIKLIPAHVFRYVPLSATFVIPDSVEEIGEYAFLGCGTFKELTLGTGLKKVGSWAFANSMVSYNIPVTYHIKDLAKWCGIDFADDGANPLRWDSAEIYAAPHAGEAETEVSNYGRPLIIPEGVTEIKAYAFWNISTQELHLPSTVTKIDPTAFGMNCNLSHYEVAAGNPTYEVQDCGVVEIATKTLVLGTVPHSGTIGEGLSKIGDYAFSGKIFTNVSIASSVTEIGAHAFESCRIQSLEIGENVKKIGDWAFANNKSGDTGIGAVVIPASVTEIGESAFYMSGVTSLALGEKVEKIGENAFASNDGLTSVTIPASVTELGKGAFSCKGLTEATFGDTGWTVTDFYGYDVTPNFGSPADVATALRNSSNVWTKNA